MNKQNSEWITGKNGLLEGLESGQEIQKVYLGDYLETEVLRQLIKIVRKHKISVLTVPRTKLDKLCKSNHQGVLALISPIRFENPYDLASHAFESGVLPVMAMLDGVTDVHNFGAIARSAEVLGITGLIIGKRNSAPVNHEAIKISAGALLRIPICKETSLFHTLRNLKKMGFTVLAADERATLRPREADLKKPLVIIMGSEGEGISYELKSEADLSVSIPQAGKINSLNVSVAAGILFYEVMLQRQE